MLFMADRISNNISSIYPAVAVGCSPPFKALFTRRFSTAPESPIQKRFSFFRSSSSVPGHSPYRLRPCERACELNDPGTPRYLHDSNVGRISSDNGASNYTYGSEEAFGSRVSTLERHVEAVRGLDKGDDRGDGFEEDGIRVQHDFVGRLCAPLTIMADIGPCEDLVLCAVLADVPKQSKPCLTSYLMATYVFRNLLELVYTGR